MAMYKKYIESNVKADEDLTNSANMDDIENASTDTINSKTEEDSTLAINLGLNNCSPSENCELSVDEVIKGQWEKDQAAYKTKLEIEDVDEWTRAWASNGDREGLKYIGGVDISFVKGDNVNACAAFVVLSFDDLEVVHEDLSMVKLTAPYIPGFLAFREADILIEKVQTLKREKPELMPQVILVDGNGILHPRGFGLACQMGVIMDLPTIGVAKNFYHVDGMEKDEEHHKSIESLTRSGDNFPLVGNSGKTWGKALKSTEQATKPVFVSPGHKVSVDTAVSIVHACCKVRIPEPTRQADIRSREYLRTNWTVD